MRRFLFYLIQSTWGVLQNLAGFAVFLRYLGHPHKWYHGAVVTTWDSVDSLSLGMFIFLSPGRNLRTDKTGDERERRLLVHEYGHTVQSLILGPLYLFLIGIPSFVWAKLPQLRSRRRKSGTSYFRFYTERWANALGERATNEPSMGEAKID